MDWPNWEMAWEFSLLKQDSTVLSLGCNRLALESKGRIIVVKRLILYRIDATRGLDPLIAQLEQECQPDQIGAQRRRLADFEVLDTQPNDVIAALVFQPGAIGEAGRNYATG